MRQRLSWPNLIQKKLDNSCNHPSVTACFAKCYPKRTVYIHPQRNRMLNRRAAVRVPYPLNPSDFIKLFTLISLKKKNQCSLFFKHARHLQRFDLHSQFKKHTLLFCFRYSTMALPKINMAVKSTVHSEQLLLIRNARL